jgi:hypothetical protein
MRFLELKWRIVSRTRNGSDPGSASAPQLRLLPLSPWRMFLFRPEGLHIGKGPESLPRHLGGLYRQVARPLSPAGRS